MSAFSRPFFMRKPFLLIVFLFITICCISQQVETARYEVENWKQDMDCKFVSFQEQGGIFVVESDWFDEEKNRLWNFCFVDSSLYEQQVELVHLPDKLKIFDGAVSAKRAVFVFCPEKSQNHDSTTFFVVTYDRQNNTFSTFSDHVVEKSVFQSLAVIDATMVLSINERSGGGYLLFYDLESGQRKKVRPLSGDGFVNFQLSGAEHEKKFVLAVREYVDKRYKSTSFWIYSTLGQLLGRHQFENGENSGLGRMCFAFDEQSRLKVYGTLERETQKKTSIKGVTEDFDRSAVGVVWLHFVGEKPLVRTYLFKDMPEIEHALTPYDRVLVNEERIRRERGSQKERGEIAFQFYQPRLIRFGDKQVFAAEAFRPVFHTETRFEYGFYGSYPITYTIFDGYEFFSEVLMAFDADGKLCWQTSLKFENALCMELSDHSAEMVYEDELVVVSPRDHKLRYEVFGLEGESLLDQHSLGLDYHHRADGFEEEYEVGISPWFGHNMVVFGTQVLQNSMMRKSRRLVSYVQKIQYE